MMLSAEESDSFILFVHVGSKQVRVVCVRIRNCECLFCAFADCMFVSVFPTLKMMLNQV